MGRRKWKLYQDSLLPRQRDADGSSEDEAMATDAPAPSLKIKTIEQINAPDEDEKPRTEREPNDHKTEERRETILESLIRKPATQPKVEYQEEPADWKPPDKCYFCVDGEPDNVAERPAAGATSPASESDSSSVSGAKSPAAPPLLQHLLQLQARNPQAVVQLQQMMATIAALNTGLVPPALSQAWLMQSLLGNRPQFDGSAESSEKVPAAESSPSTNAEQPLDLSAKSSTTGDSPPPLAKLDNSRPKTSVLEGPSNHSSRRAYTEDELQSALRDIQTGKLGTRRAAVLYGIPRSTLRNKVYKLAAEPGNESEPDSDPERADRDSPGSVILKIPTYRLPDENSPSPATPATPVTPVTPLLPPPQHMNPAALLLPPSVYADSPNSSQLFTSLSNVIAKSITQKFQLDRQQPGDMHQQWRQDRHVSVIKTPPDNQRNYAAPSNSRGPINNNGQQAPGGKGTRPKRGKYRNYDRDSLVEAVKAVQRGEMSVHRAGSYYGVPHSTLEYKVKERHLMRPRKREPKPPQDVAKPQAPKPPPPKPPMKPFTNGMNGPDNPGYPPGYPFWPPTNFVPPPPSSDMYASHMMRRLREEAPPPANGSFLEGIIRSSLERPGAALLQRLTSEQPRPPMMGSNDAPSLLRRLAGDQSEESPPIRRPRLDSAERSDRNLAAEMRETVQRLRADKLRPRNGTPTPPASTPPGATLSPPPAAPPDRP